MRAGIVSRGRFYSRRYAGNEPDGVQWIRRWLSQLRLQGWQPRAARLRLSRYGCSQPVLDGNREQLQSTSWGNREQPDCSQVLGGNAAERAEGACSQRVLGGNARVLLAESRDMQSAA